VLACLLPALILFVVFMVIPTVNVFRTSLYSWSGFSPNPRFVGFDNFTKLFGDQQFIRSFQNTIALLVVVTVVTMGMGLFLAAVMTRQKMRGRSLYRFVLYVPSVLSVVVIAGIFSAVYDQENGLLNGTLRALSLDTWQQIWLGDQQIVLYSVAFAMVWQSLGYYMVLYMSSMTIIPEELYEAAALDGASALTQFFGITLPLIWQNLRTTLTFFIMSAVNLSFVLVRAMTGGGPDGSSEVLLSYMYKQAYTNSTYGYGMAIGVVIFAFSFLVSLLVSRATKREPLQF
jgi:N-acetylglucosamine transport system permease protein